MLQLEKFLVSLNDLKDNSRKMEKKLTIAGIPMPNMPWEDRPEGCKNVMWRYSANPVIPRDLLPNSNSIFNSAIVPFEDGYAGVFRVDDTNIRMTLHAVLRESDMEGHPDVGIVNTEHTCITVFERNDRRVEYAV